MKLKSFTIENNGTIYITESDPTDLTDLVEYLSAVRLRGGGPDVTYGDEINEVINKNIITEDVERESNEGSPASEEVTEYVDRLRTPTLEHYLRTRGLSSTGNRDEMKARLVEAIEME